MKYAQAISDVGGDGSVAILFESSHAHNDGFVCNHNTIYHISRLNKRSFDFVVAYVH